MTIEQFFKEYQLFSKIFLIIVGVAGIVGSLYGVRIFYESTEKFSNHNADSKINKIIEEDKNNEIINSKIETHDQTTSPVLNSQNSLVSINPNDGVTDNTFLQANNIDTASGNRRISQEQLEILVPAMKLVCSNTIEIAYAIGDPEQKQFAEDIIKAFHAAGCNPEIPQPPIKLIMQGFGQKGLSFGLNFIPPYPAGSEELSQALNKIGIESKWIGFHDFPRNFLLVYVGERP